MKLIFFGGFFQKEKTSFFLENSINYFQEAANVLQWNIIDGIEKNLDETIDVISAPFLGVYPKNYKKIIVNSSIINNNGALNHSVGFLNIKLIGELIKYYKSRSVLLSTAKKYSNNEKIIIIIYGTFFCQVFSAIWVKKYINNVELCIIVPDLPGMMGGDNKKLKIRLVNYVNNKIIGYGLRQINYFVLISKHMKERLLIGERPWCVVEGVCGHNNELIYHKNSSPFIILYSGTLAKRYGIVGLLEAFVRIKDDLCELWVCGSGDGLEDVVNYQKLHKNIKYFGQISREEVVDMQKKSSLLVNPRKFDGDYTKYSFPSKIIEYFSSGVAVLMYRLPGVPDEYYNYCFVPGGDGIDDLCKSIVEIKNMNRDDLINIGMSARNFVTKEKNSKHQCKKIIDMLKNNSQS